MRRRRIRPAIVTHPVNTVKTVTQPVKTVKLPVETPPGPTDRSHPRAPRTRIPFPAAAAAAAA